jgi:hypothetical protein
MNPLMYGNRVRSVVLHPIIMYRGIPTNTVETMLFEDNSVVKDL